MTYSKTFLTLALERGIESYNAVFLAGFLSQLLSLIQSPSMGRNEGGNGIRWLLNNKKFPYSGRNDLHRRLIYFIFTYYIIEYIIEYIRETIVPEYGY